VSVARVLAVALTDARTRLRRPGTAVLIFVAAVGCYLAIPDPSTGTGLLHIGGARALYTSPALAFATAVLVAMLLSLFGFYLSSNALARDLRTRMAPVVAATPVRSLEYLMGKLAGSVVLLAGVALGAMIAAMAMQVVRGEGPLQPATFLAHYALFLGPCIAWVAAVALVFECAPGLSGRVGDVLYFFFWSLTIALGAEPWRKPAEGISWLGRCVDYAGIGLAVDEVQRIAGTSQFSIGYDSSSPTGPTTTFPGLELTRHAVETRALALVVPALLLPLALLFFHRFDPSRRRAFDAAGRGGFLALLGALSWPLARPILATLDRVSPDAALTFRRQPPLALLSTASAVLGIALPTTAVRQVVLPVLFAVLSAALADVATRERHAGFLPVVFSAPRRRVSFAAWKLVTAALSAALVAGIPVMRVLVFEPRSGVSALIGLSFLAALSVCLGIATGTPKTFVGVSLALWYVALNARGHSPALDYGGWWAAATPLTQAGWAAAAVAAAALALVAHRVRIAREG
jgi:hypothetical protein